MNYTIIILSIDRGCLVNEDYFSPYADIIIHNNILFDVTMDTRKTWPMYPSRFRF